LKSSNPPHNGDKKAAALVRRTLIIMSMGRDFVSEMRSPMDLLFIPWLYMSLENRGGMVSTGEISLVHQSCLAILPAE
jgi:hypothetical protein